MTLQEPITHLVIDPTGHCLCPCLCPLECAHHTQEPRVRARLCSLQSCGSLLPTRNVGRPRPYGWHKACNRQLSGPMLRDYDNLFLLTHVRVSS